MADANNISLVNEKQCLFLQTFILKVYFRVAKSCIIVCFTYSLSIAIF